LDIKLKKIKRSTIVNIVEMVSIICLSICLGALYYGWEVVISADREISAARYMGILLLFSLILSVVILILHAEVNKQNNRFCTFIDKIPLEVQVPSVLLLFFWLNSFYLPVYELSDWQGHGINILRRSLMIGLIILQGLSLIRIFQNKQVLKQLYTIGFLKYIANILKKSNTRVYYKVMVIVCFGAYIGISLVSVVIIVTDSEVWPLAILLLIGVNVIAVYELINFVDKLYIIMSYVRERRNKGECEALGIERLTPFLRELGEDLEALYEGLDIAIEERLKGEKMRSELVTNVTHDLKNPLTSIISYVKLLRDCNIQDKEAEGFIEVLDEKSKRLKGLIDQLVEVSKATSGMMEVCMETVDVIQLNRQLLGEFDEAFRDRNLNLIVKSEQPPMDIYTDPKILYRILENLMSNIQKYAMENSRVYMDIEEEEKQIKITMKNISKEALNMPIEELTKRFVRGDESRNEEGSGLGLSIALSLAELIKINLKLSVDGDLFKSELWIQKSEVVNEYEMILVEE